MGDGVTADLAVSGIRSVIARNLERKTAKPPGSSHLTQDDTTALVQGLPRHDDAGGAMTGEGSPDTNGSNPRETDNKVVVTKVSPWSMADTVTRLSAVVAARGLKVFAVIDHSDEARRVGLALRDTKLFIVGSPSVSAAAIEAAPLAALDLPLRVVVWEDGLQTKVSYPSPAEVARRYGLDADLATALEAIDAWTSAVVDR